MEDNNYEQEFIKSVRETNSVTPPANKVTNDSKGASILPLVVSIVLALIVLVESVALAIFAINYAEILGLSGEDEGDAEYVPSNDSPEALSEDSIYTFDSNYNITAFDIVCATDDGTKYTFTKAGNYEKTDSSSNTVDSGSYSIINGGAVVLADGGNTNSNKKKVVYYDGVYIMEDTTFYTCDAE